MYMCMKREQWNLLKLFQGEGEGLGENDGGVNLIKIHCKHMCKCYNKIQCTTNIC
jgi:hypothetical protein